MTDPLRGWAERYDEELGGLPSGHRPAAQRAKVLMSSRRQTQRGASLGRKIGAWSVAATLAIGAALALSPASNIFRNQAPEPILLGELPVQAGTSISASGGNRLLRFPEGSRVTWTEGATGVLSKVDESAVELKLAEGTLNLDVEKKAGRRWIVNAGNFKVFVIGTAFSVSRDAQTEAFQVRVSRGKVRVEGAKLEGGELFLGQGEEFSWNPPKKPETTRENEDARAQSSAEKTPPDVTTPVATPPVAGRPDPKTTETWQSLARAGKYELAVELVLSQGAPNVLGGSSAEDRVLLGNAARYSGRIDLSNRAYRAARELPGPSSTLAAYYLAKVALDSNGDQGQAINWLRTYLREAPSGDLSASARARLMSLLSAAGRLPEARTVARDYLELNSGGPQTKLAKQLLDRP